MPQAKVRKIKFASQADKNGVKECLVWRDPSDKKKHSATHHERSEFVLPQKGEIGKPTVRGYEPMDYSVAFHVKPGADDHVIDALRGWHGKQDEVGEAAIELELFRETTLEKEARERSVGMKKTKKKKGDSKRPAGGWEGDNLPDPFMGDLISHKFMKDAVRERELQSKEAVDAARKKARIEYAKKFPKDIKATKASQLRSIAKAEAITNDPKSLWQISRFKENAEPHLDTFRKTRNKGGSDNDRNKPASKKTANNAEGVDNAVFDTCTCAEEAGMTNNPMYMIDDYPEPELEFPRNEDNLMETTDNME